jgi:hypothetical protein
LRRKRVSGEEKRGERCQKKKPQKKLERVLLPLPLTELLLKRIDDMNEIGIATTSSAAAAAKKVKNKQEIPHPTQITSI